MACSHHVDLRGFFYCFEFWPRKAKFMAILDFLASMFSVARVCNVDDFWETFAQPRSRYFVRYPHCVCWGNIAGRSVFKIETQTDIIQLSISCVLSLAKTPSAHDFGRLRELMHGRFCAWGALWLNAHVANIDIASINRPYRHTPPHKLQKVLVVPRQNSIGPWVRKVKRVNTRLIL